MRSARFIKAHNPCPGRTEAHLVIWGKDTIKGSLTKVRAKVTAHTAKKKKKLLFTKKVLKVLQIRYNWAFTMF